MDMQVLEPEKEKNVVNAADLEKQQQMEGLDDLIWYILCKLTRRMVGKKSSGGEEQDATAANEYGDVFKS